MTTNTSSNLMAQYKEFARKAQIARQNGSLPSTEDMFNFGTALTSYENTPETLKEAYHSLGICIRPNLPTEEAERIMDLFAVALKNPQNDKTSLNSAASRLNYMDEMQITASMPELTHALSNNIKHNANPSEALSNSYDFFYNISKTKSLAYETAYKQVANLLQSPENDEKSVFHALDGLNNANKNSPERSMSFHRSTGFFAVIDSSLNRPNPPIYHASKAIMSNLPKFRDRGHTKALNKLDDLLKNADSSQTSLLIQAMTASELPETCPGDCLKLIQSKLNQETEANDRIINSSTLSHICTVVQKAATADTITDPKTKSELIGQVSDTYTQIMKHPSCTAETLEDVYSGLSETIKKHPEQAKKLFKTYQKAMSHEKNDDESKEEAQIWLSNIAKTRPNCAASVKQLLQQEENKNQQPPIISKQGGHSY